jgi:hypothetical protein
MTGMRSNAMATQDAMVSVIARAIEQRDAMTLTSLYADDALLRIIDHDNPPSAPREIRGRQAIAAYYDDVCGRAMTHQVDAAISDGESVSFTQTCAYPEGGKVFCATTLRTRDGKIVSQTAVQAWDS